MSLRARRRNLPRRGFGVDDEIAALGAQEARAQRQSYAVSTGILRNLSAAYQNANLALHVLSACAAPAIAENCLSPLGNLSKKSSRSSIDAMPSYSPRTTRTGERICNGSTTGNFEVISR